MTTNNLHDHRVTKHSGSFYLYVLLIRPTRLRRSQYW